MWLRFLSDNIGKRVHFGVVCKRKEPGFSGQVSITGRQRSFVVRWHRQSGSCRTLPQREQSVNSNRDRCHGQKSRPTMKRVINGRWTSHSRRVDIFFCFVSSLIEKKQDVANEMPHPLIPIVSSSILLSSLPFTPQCDREQIPPAI